MICSSDGGSGVGVLEACGFRVKNDCIWDLDKQSAVKLATPGI